MKTISKLMVLLLLAGVCVAQPVLSDSEPAAKHHTAKKAKKKAVAPASAEDVKQLKELIQEQQAQIDQLKQQAAQRDQQTTQATTDAQKAAADAEAKAAAAQAAAAAAATKADITQSDVAGLKTTVDSTVVTVGKNEKRVGELEEPAYMHYKGVQIIPGGYAELDGIYRSKNMTSDSASKFGSIPFSGTSNAALNEWRFTARHSNLNVTVKGKAHGLDATAYAEIDFQGAANTASETATNSYNPRLRELWANVDTESGWSFLGGQTWSLITPNRKGIHAKAENRPSLIDATYLVGFHYAREGTFRVAKSFMDKKATFAIAVENPDTSITSKCSGATAALATCPTFISTIQGLSTSANTSVVNNNFGSTLPSTNIAPDVAAKIAFDPGFGHIEVGGIARFFRDRVLTGAATAAGAAPNSGTNNVTVGGAVTLNMIVPVLPKKVDFVFDSLAGRGIGRFGAAGGPDVTFNNRGSLVPVRAAQAVAGFEIHPTPKLTFNVYGGLEYYDRTVYNLSATQLIGYGAPAQTVNLCSNEIPGTCNADNRTIWEITPQLWYNFWKGKAGTLQYGLEYEYTHRAAWRGASALSPAIENTVMTSFRYYIP